MDTIPGIEQVIASEAHIKQQRSCPGKKYASISNIMGVGDAIQTKCSLNDVVIVNRNMVILDQAA